MNKKIIKISIIDNKKSLQLNADNCSENNIFTSMAVEKMGSEYEITVNQGYDAVFGFGEKFDNVNQKNNKVLSSVIEKCFDQGEFTYCPLPFFYVRDGYGFFVDTLLPVKFDFTGKMKISFGSDSKGNIPSIYLFLGTPQEIINEFTNLTGRTKIFPKWVYGVWMSSNRWDCDEHIMEQLDQAKKNKLPANVMVIECWSDETTYYIWNGAKYNYKKGNENFKYEDFDFSISPKWKDPKKLIEDIHSYNIKVLLWELPMYAGLQLCKNDTKQHEADLKFAIENKNCVMKKDGKEYIIPKGNWYASSTVPDFTNKETIKNWFGKKQYLLDMGIDGFKTDGGEFIYEDDALFSNGLTGLEMKNGYAQSYLKAYSDFIGSDRINYSRAGYIGQQSVSTHWAGDQESNWSEFRAILKAGLSATMSGIAVWGFDLAGFASFLPSKELYVRSTQMAVFTPIMQWHSEPINNGPCDPTGVHKNNDRSPWNMADYLKDENLIEELRFHYNLRYNLIPYLYNLALNSTDNGMPIMKHLIIDYPQDKECINIDDQFMLGDIMVAPIVNEGMKERSIYFPQGNWIDMYTNKVVVGGQRKKKTLESNRIPTYIRENGCVVVNLDDSLEIGTYVGNDLDKYNNLVFIVNGNGKFTFRDDIGNLIRISWDNGKYSVVENKLDTKINVKFV